MPKPSKEENHWIEADRGKCLVHLEWDGDYWWASDASFPDASFPDPIYHRTKSGALDLATDAVRKYHSVTSILPTQRGGTRLQSRDMILRTGTLLSIIEQSGLTREEFLLSPLPGPDVWMKCLEAP